MSNTEDSGSDIHTNDVTRNSIEVSSLELRRMDPEKLNPSRLYNDDPSRGSKHLRESIESLGVETPIRARIEDGEIKYIDGGRRVDGAEQAGEKVPVWLPGDGQWSDEKVLLSRLLANTGALSEETDWLRRAWLLQDWWDAVGDSQIPGLKEVSTKVGISKPTASRWVEPLRRRWNNTIIDRDMFDENQVFQPESNDKNIISGLRINEITDKVNPRRLQDINSIVYNAPARENSSRLRTKLLNRYVRDDISYDELKQLKKRVDDENIPPEKALNEIRDDEDRTIETELSGEVAEKVNTVSDQTGKDASEIIEEGAEKVVQEEQVELGSQEETLNEYIGQFDYLDANVDGPIPEPDLRIESNDRMEKLPPESIELTVTSPPYNVAWDYGEIATDNQPYEQYLDDLIRKTFSEALRLTVPGGYCCIVVPHIIDVENEEMETPVGTPIAGDVIDVLTDEGWTLFGLVTWNKKFNKAGFRNQEFPYPESKLNNFSEAIIVLKKPGEREVNEERREQSKIKYDNSVSDRDLRDNVWTISPAMWEPSYTDEVDTAQFPEELAKRCILHYSYVGDTVLDPFCGRGTTLKMAKQLYRESIGYEIQEELERDIREYVGME
jgi:DNA modification methylase